MFEYSPLEDWRLNDMYIVFVIARLESHFQNYQLIGALFTCQ